MKRFTPLALTAIFALTACAEEPATVSYFENFETQDEAEKQYYYAINNTQNSNNPSEYFPADKLDRDEVVSWGHEICGFIIKDPDPFGLEVASEYMTTHGLSVNAQESMLAEAKNWLCPDAADEAFEKLKKSTYGY